MYQSSCVCFRNSTFFLPFLEGLPIELRQQGQGLLSCGVHPQCSGQVCRASPVVSRSIFVICRTIPFLTADCGLRSVDCFSLSTQHVPQRQEDMSAERAAVHCFSMVESCQQVSFSASIVPRVQLVDQSPESSVGRAEKPRAFTDFSLGKRRPGKP